MISGSVLAAVLAHIDGYGDSDGDDALLASLRAQFGGLHFSLCADDDVPERLSPAASNARYRLYYVDSAGHCLQLTNDADAASGLLVAWIEAEEQAVEEGACATIN